MDFSLATFYKPLVDEKPPDWAKSTTTLKLYREVIVQRNQILKAINLGVASSIKDRRLIAKKIAEACGFSPSILSARRQPDICKLIIELNEELELAVNSIDANSNKSGRIRTKKEIEIISKFQKDELSRITNLKLAEAMTAAINNLSIQRSRNQANTIIKLKVKIMELEQIIERQAIQLQTTFKLVE